MRKVIITVLFSKLIIFLVILAAYNVLPFSQGSYLANFHIYNKISLQTIFSTWDAQHYLSLAMHGYTPNSESDRFFPLFPLLIRILSPITGYLLGGLFVANVASLIGCIYFYLFTKDFSQNKKMAYISLLVLLCFPTIFFFSFVYSEGLFFCFIMMAFYYLYKKQLLLSALSAFFIPLVRPTGIFILIPFFVYILSDYIREVFAVSKKPLSKTHIPLRPSVLLLVTPSIAFLLYLFFMANMTGNPFSGFAFQNDIAGHFSIGSFFHWNLLTDIIPKQLVLHDPNNSLLDRLFFVVFLSSLSLIWRRTDKVLFTYALIMGIVPLLGSFMSYTRYMLMVFPLFISLGSIFSEKKYSWMLFLYEYPVLLLQALFIVMHCLNYWVA